MSVFILLFIKTSSLTTKKGRERQRREKQEERRNVLITLKEASSLPTHIAESPTHRHSQRGDNTHTEILPKAKMNRDKKKRGMRGRDSEIERITKGLKIKSERNKEK